MPWYDIVYLNSILMGFMVSYKPPSKRQYGVGRVGGVGGVARVAIAPGVGVVVVEGGGLRGQVRLPLEDPPDPCGEYSLT